MGWLQVKRWLSFLPAAFVVYILLHYLVYQPDLPGPQPDAAQADLSGARVMNGSLVPDVLGPGTSAEGHDMPMLIQDIDSQVTVKDLNTQPPVPPEPAAVAGSAGASTNGHPISSGDINTTQQHQGSATVVDSTNSHRITRFDSARKALGSVSFREPLSALPQKEEVNYISEQVGFPASGYKDADQIGFNNSETKQSFLTDDSISNVESNSYGVLHGPQDVHITSSGVPRANDHSLPEPLGNENFVSSLGSLLSSTSSLPSSSSSSLPSSLSDVNGRLLKESYQSSLSAIHPDILPSNSDSSSAVGNPESLAYQPHVLPAQSLPSHPSDPFKLVNPSLTVYDDSDAHQRLGDTAVLYNQQNLRYPYQFYADGSDSPSYPSPYQHYKLPEEMMMEEAFQRSHVLFHQQQQQQQSGIGAPAGNLNLPPPLPPIPRIPEFSSRHGNHAYPSDDQGLRIAEERNLLPQGPAGPPSHPAVKASSTIQSISSSSSSSSLSSSIGNAAKAVTKGASGGPPPPEPAAVVPPAKSKPQASNVVVVQGTGSAPQPRQSVTKKTTVVKKSNVASSSSLSINALSGKTKVGEKYESGFSVPHEELCINNGRDLKVLVLITTAPDHEKHRTAVRQTWGHFAIRKDVVMAFVVGRTTNINIQNNLDKENEIYGDIIQANFIDHYANLTLKTISMFEWVKTYCSESHFVLKTDDDMFINMPLLLTFIDSKKSDRRVMYGRLAKGWKPVRNKKSKYYIDVATYKKSKYPDFLTGPAYLFTSDIVDDIYQKALGTTFFVLEDVLVTGIVGESLRIRRVGDSRFRNEKIKLTDTCALMKTVSIHMVKYEEQFDIYKRTLDGKAKCKTG